MVAQADKVEALAVVLLAVVPMDVNQLVGVGVRLFQYRIVDDEPGELAGRPPGLNLANQGLGLPPAVGRAVGGLAQPARDVVVAQRSVQQPRQVCGRRLARRTQQKSVYRSSVQTIIKLLNEHTKPTTA